MKKIRIFLASSSELKEDRDQFDLFISHENDRWMDEGIRLEIVRWENFLDAISDTRLQDEYNKKISQCEIVVCLFFTKVGKYTAEEFDTAYQVFKDKGKPKIWTYFKDAAINTGSITDEINTLLEFKKKISKLGHFYTEYKNIDNLKVQYQGQLNIFLKQFKNLNPSDSEPDRIDTPKIIEPVTNTFNQLLKKRLLEAIKPYSKNANDFLNTYQNWESNDDLVKIAKTIIQKGYVGVVGIQLRKILTIGEEDFSESKMERYLENCLLAAKRALQLINYSMLSKLWDCQLSVQLKFSQTQTDMLIKFYKNAAEETITGFALLLKTLNDIFNDNNLEIPFQQLKDLLPNLKEGGNFMEACNNLNTVTDLLKQSSISVDSCADAEKNLTVILEQLNFLAEYKMISIKDIDYALQRNDKEGTYLHNYTLLEGDNISNNSNEGKVNRESKPVISNSVLLCKGNLRQNINLDPFIIDYNVLGLSDGSKICFFSFCNTFNDNSLNYSFFEDNSIVTVKKSNNQRPDEKDKPALNNWLAIKANKINMNFDNVFDLFQETKKAFTGMEDSTSEDTL